MRVILFGATGMVGQGVLRECIVSPRVSAILSVVRRASAGTSPFRSEKVTELVTDNFYDYSAIEPQFSGCDACFFSLGVSSVGMKEPEYRHVTYDLTLAAAQAVLRANPTTPTGGLTFTYVSGAGTNANGGQMWARVKGETENALLAMPFKAAYMLRPGAIVPLHGIRSKTRVYQTAISIFRPVMPLLLRAFPNHVTTTEQVGRAMLSLAEHGYPKHILEPADIIRCGSAA